MRRRPGWIVAGAVFLTVVGDLEVEVPVVLDAEFRGGAALGAGDAGVVRAARAGELLAKGADALRSGDAGFEAARRARLRTIPAEVMLTTSTAPGTPGLYHCLVRYRVGRRWYRDDPSARLGMNGRVDPTVRARWSAARAETPWRTS